MIKSTKKVKELSTFTQANLTKNFIKSIVSLEIKGFTMPRGGKRKNSGRPSTWASGCGNDDTIPIRVPKHIKTEVWDYAHRLDAYLCGGTKDVDNKYLWLPDIAIKDTVLIRVPKRYQHQLSEIAHQLHQGKKVYLENKRFASTTGEQLNLFDLKSP